jgi:branched-chain amino acid transport system ATP-binding protein
LIAEPSVLLLDEPAAGLSDMECTGLTAVMKDAAAQALVIVVEHNMQVIYGSASRVLVLLNGRLVADAPPAAIKDDPLVREAYLGTAWEAQVAG